MTFYMIQSEHEIVESNTIFKTQEIAEKYFKKCFEEIKEDLEYNSYEEYLEEGLVDYVELNLIEEKDFNF